MGKRGEGAKGITKVKLYAASFEPCLGEQSVEIRRGTKGAGGVEVQARFPPGKGIVCIVNRTLQERLAHAYARIIIPGISHKRFIEKHLRHFVIAELEAGSAFFYVRIRTAGKGHYGNGVEKQFYDWYEHSHHGMLSTTARIMVASRQNRFLN
jgi:hypothetical protein